MSKLLEGIGEAEVSEETRAKFKDLAVRYEGTEIILPKINDKPMSYDEAIDWLKRKREEDQRETQFHHEFKCSPLDGAVAFSRALAHIYGWVESVDTPPRHMFDTKHPPKMIGVPVSATETMQVPFGRVQIPGIEGHLETGIDDDPEPKFIISGVVKKKHAEDIKKIVAETKRFLKEHSIYKGRAVKVSWQWEHDEDDYDPIQHAPQFMELSQISDDDLIFGEEMLNDLKIGLFTPIEQAAACRKVGIPLKRGVLLYGPYGTGKTMTAYVSALKAERHGWTFVYLDNVRDLKKALDFAAQYAPCVLFAEDIDRVMKGERTIDMDEVLNTLDGVDTKGAEIITVFTTNHIEDINPATLRMGRLDTLVHVTPPDAEAVQRLIRLYSRGLLEQSADLTKIGEALAGQIPAFIREVTERAKIAAIARVGSASIKGKVLEEDLLASAKAMQPHAEFLKPRNDKPLDVSNLQVLVPGHRIADFQGNGKTAALAN